MLLNWGNENGVDVLIYRLPLVVGENAKGNLQFASNLIKLLINNKNILFNNN
jgi:nucleoside-diphosphate-sugar epimerase